ncbi:MAG: SDR family NAD(P)-dependent oxidoreductase [Spirochaetota bacterium]
MSRDNKKTGRKEFLAKAGLTTAAVSGALLNPAQAIAGEYANSSQEWLENFSKSYKGKTAFITGGARGIGLAAAEMFARNGANVVIFDIASKRIRGVGHSVASEYDLRKAKSKIEKYGVQCLAIKGDVRNKKSIVNAVEKAVKRFQSIDFMVANAGVTQIGDLVEFDDEEISAILDINISGVIKTTQAVIPQMKKQKSGRIIFISSILGRRGNKDWAVYSASKWAVIGFAKSSAHLLGKYNITCNAICPGLVDTKLVNNDFVLKRWFPGDPKWSNVVKWVEQNSTIPKGVYQPSEIADAIKIFCDNGTSTVTGEVLDISMGASAEATA